MTYHDLGGTHRCQAPPESSQVAGVGIYDAGHYMTSQLSHNILPLSFDEMFISRHLGRIDSCSDAFNPGPQMVSEL